MDTNRPFQFDGNIPLALVGQRLKRRYTKATLLLELAVTKYRHNNHGITFCDLIQSGFAKHKRQAPLTLKNACKNNVLFTLEKRRPQKYYPISIKSEIVKDRLSTKNALKDLPGLLFVQERI